MPTSDPLALITAKKLLGYLDFDVYLKQYLVKAIRDATKRLFVQGSFDERMPLSSPGADQVQVDLKPTYGDGFAHDGSGRLLDLEQIDRTAYFENVGGQTYEVGAEYIEYPTGIRVNPRTGKYEYDHMVEGIGRQAAVNVDTINLSTLTFVVDALFEEGVSAGDHTGRQVRVFTIVPGDAATSEAIAIETATVFYDGQNKITTAGYLGETVPGTVGGWYVQLIGITVFRDTATNRPSQLPDSVLFIGTVDGNGATPTVFDITGQNVITAQSAAFVTTDPLPNWYDGTTNTAATVQAALEKIVSDLTSTTGGRGAAKLSAAARSDWADATTNPATGLDGALDKIITDLTATTAGRGAAKLTAAALADWADATTNPAGLLSDVLGKLVTDLTATTGARGAGKLTAAALTGSPYAIGAQRLDETLQEILDDLNTTAIETGPLRWVVDALTQWRVLDPLSKDHTGVTSLAYHCGATQYIEDKFVVAIGGVYNNDPDDGLAKVGCFHAVDGGSGYVRSGPNNELSTTKLIHVAKNLIGGEIKARFTTYAAAKYWEVTIGTATTIGGTPTPWASNTEHDLFWGPVSGYWWCAADSRLWVDSGAGFEEILDSPIIVTYVRELSSGRIVMISENGTPRIYYIDPPYTDSTFVGGPALTGAGTITGCEVTTSGIVIIDDAGHMYRSVDGSSLDASVASFVDANMQMFRFGEIYGYPDMLVFVPYNAGLHALPNVQVHIAFADTPGDVITLPPTGPFAIPNNTARYQQCDGGCVAAVGSTLGGRKVFVSQYSASVSIGGAPLA